MSRTGFDGNGHLTIDGRLPASTEHRIEVYNDGGNRPWRYRVIAADGKVIKQSEGYSRKDGAVRGTTRGERSRAMSFQATPTFEQLEEKGIWEPTSGCLLWLGGRTVAGYGLVNVAGRRVYVHRLALEAAIGTQLGELDSLHRCDNPPCFAQHHLFPGTQLDNSRDCARKGRARSGNEGKTECPHGHPYSGDNLILGENVNGNPRRGCRECGRRVAREYQRRINGVPVERYRVL